ncbi:hypothetical protein ACFVS2_22100 [Brevibacillus sp. NPDC058079]|uniref:hypothetical protein n=1 Tax=Brevibacillus sp. NPDC058079 TaxID=3346330 RepID=UPI0036EA9CB1
MFWKIFFFGMLLPFATITVFFIKALWKRLKVRKPDDFPPNQVYPDTDDLLSAGFFYAVGLAILCISGSYAFQS